MSDAKGVEVTSTALPSGLRPGDTARARITVQNSTLLTSPWDDDRCVGDHAGMSVEGVVIGPDGQEWSGGPVCVEQSDLIRKFEEEIEVTFTAPGRDGSHRYEMFARLAESGEETARRAGRVDVYANPDDAPAEPPEEDTGIDWGDVFGGGDGDGSDGSDGSDGEGWSWPWEDSDGSDIFQKIDTLILVIVLLAGFYAAGQLFDIQIGGSA